MEASPLVSGHAYDSFYSIRSMNTAKIAQAIRARSGPTCGEVEISDRRERTIVEVQLFGRARPRRLGLVNLHLGTLGVLRAVLIV